ncbi:hypothetical protein M758_1G051400 [Ceratodon purpureus]|uniref:Secreted protein n=1 Tax=Ceratodon purpureus TaxID=3225 RepID=A0A8T0J2N9_CERPU|nr:hypothetical protein KC19_1G054000 [Ceratodon purpureus]KAG0628763.1 hypothetical protein M758_1G051400 [Ceratodon purpureus]
MLPVICFWLRAFLIFNFHNSFLSCNFLFESPRLCIFSQSHCVDHVVLSMAQKLFVRLWCVATHIAMPFKILNFFLTKSV